MQKKSHTYFRSPPKLESYKYLWFSKSLLLTLIKANVTKQIGNEVRKVGEGLGRRPAHTYTGGGVGKREGEGDCKTLHNCEIVRKRR